MQFPERIAPCLRRTPELRVDTARNRPSAEHSLFHLRRESTHIPVGDVGGHRHQPPRALVGDEVPTRGTRHAGHLPQGDQAAGEADQRKATEVLRPGPGGGIEKDDHIDHAIGEIDLAGDRAAGTGFDGGQDIIGPEPRGGDRRGPKPDRDAGDHRWGVVLDVRGPVDLPEQRRRPSRAGVEAVEIVTIELEYEVGRGAGQCFLDALAEEAANGEVDARHLDQALPEIVDDAGGITGGQRHQVHLELAVVSAPGVLGQFGTPGALSDTPHPRVGPEDGRHEIADPDRLGQRGAGHQRHVDQEVAFVELRQEAGPEIRQGGRGGHADQCRRRRDGAGARGQLLEHAQVAALEPGQEP